MLNNSLSRVSQLFFPFSDEDIDIDDWFYRVKTRKKFAILLVKDKFNFYNVAYLFLDIIIIILLLFYIIIILYYYYYAFCQSEIYLLLHYVAIVYYRSMLIIYYV